MYHVNNKGTLHYYTSRKYRVSDMNPSHRIGTFKIEAKGTRYPDDDDENIEDRYSERYVIDINIDEGEEGDHQFIRQAIRDTFSANHCQHEYDCCGCRSWYCRETYHIKDGLWYVIVSSARNY